MSSRWQGAAIVAALSVCTLILWPGLASRAQTTQTTPQVVFANPYTNQPGGTIRSAGGSQHIYSGSAIHEYRIWCTAGQLVLTSEMASSGVTLQGGQSTDIAGQTITLLNGSNGTGQYIRID